MSELFEIKIKIVENCWEVEVRLRRRRKGGRKEGRVDG